MFKGIRFQTTTAKKRLTSSKLISDKIARNKGYNIDAIRNAEFSISGRVDHFSKPPITEYAIKNLSYLVDFDRFYYDRGSYTMRSDFSSFIVGYTYSGKGMLRFNDKDYTLKEGDGFYINCMNSHYYEAISDVWDVAILTVNGPLLAYHTSLYMQYGSPVFHTPLHGEFQEYLEKILYYYDNPVQNRDILASGCINNLLNLLLVIQSEDSIKDSALPGNIRNLIQYMENNYTHPLTLDYLSDIAGFSKYYLSREFKKYTGFSPIDYLLTLRINKAITLLLSTDLPAVKIAYETGFNDVDNFTNIFKKKTGFTPIQYRKQF